MELRTSHPGNHMWCDDCPCDCANRQPYEARCGTMCMNCHGMVERKFTHRFVTVSEGGGITILTSAWDPVSKES